jgi:nucleoside-diphosphate-sugar epimerase
MSAIRVLFIGGTGTISSACAGLAVERDVDLTVLNRGQNSSRPLPARATLLRGDVRDPASLRAALGDREFDAVVNWVTFTADQLRTDLDGDGTSLWTLTHHQDFAKGFVPLLGNSRALGEAFHITSDEALTWNQIARILGRAAGCEPRIAHVPSDAIAAVDPAWGAGLLGDKSHSMVFDNSKLRRIAPDYVATIPFEQGAREIVEWFDADPARQMVDAEMDQTMDLLVSKYQV